MHVTWILEILSCVRSRYYVTDHSFPSPPSDDPEPRLLWMPPLLTSSLFRAIFILRDVFSVKRAKARPHGLTAVLTTTGMAITHRSPSWFRLQHNCFSVQFLLFLVVSRVSSPPPLPDMGHPSSLQTPLLHLSSRGGACPFLTVASSSLELDNNLLLVLSRQ